jgi:hypothetical protein
MRVTLLNQGLPSMAAHTQCKSVMSKELRAVELKVGRSSNGILVEVGMVGIILAPFTTSSDGQSSCLSPGQSFVLSGSSFNIPMAAACENYGLQSCYYLTPPWYTAYYRTPSPPGMPPAALLSYVATQSSILSDYGLGISSCSLYWWEGAPIAHIPASELTAMATTTIYSNGIFNPGGAVPTPGWTPPPNPTQTWPPTIPKPQDSPVVAQKSSSSWYDGPSPAQTSRHPPSDLPANLPAASPPAIPSLQPGSPSPQPWPSPTPSSRLSSPNAPPSNDRDYPEAQITPNIVSFMSGEDGFVIGGSITIPAGSSTMVNGHSMFVPFGGSRLVVDGTTMMIPLNTIDSIQPILTIGSQSAAISFGPSGGVVLPNSGTLLPGSATIIDGTLVSLSPSPTALVIGSKTVAITYKPATPTITVGNQLATVGYSPSGGVVLPNGDTLIPGSSTMVDGTLVSLSPSHTALVVGSSTISLLTPSAYTTGPSSDFVIVGSATLPVIYVTSAGGGVVLPNSATLLPGSSTIIDGTMYSLSPSETILVVGSSTVALTLSTTPNPGDYIWSGLGGSSYTGPVSFGSKVTSAHATLSMMYTVWLLVLMLI